MKLRLPLYAKILLWFFLNIALLFVVGWLTLRQQTHSGFDSFVSEYVLQRAEPVVELVFLQLGDTPTENWDNVLNQFSDIYGVQFILCNDFGEWMAGDEISIPKKVLHRMPKPPRPKDRQERADEKRERSAIRPFPKDAPSGLPPIHQRFFIQTSNPQGNWAGYLGAIRREEQNGVMPSVLLIHSKTFTANGLFFNYTPWVIAGLGVLLLSALLWFPLIRDITRAISMMNSATARIAEGNFDARVDEKRGDELGQLGGGINRMSARLFNYVKGQKRFLGDVAHELCSPIARLQMALGIMEQRADAQQKPYLDDLQEEVQHMSNLVNELLSFSKASLRPADVKLQTVNLKSIAEMATKREAAGQGEVVINVPDNLCASANPDMLQRAVSNLLRNALRYAGQAGPITIDAKGNDERVKLTIADHGPGIPAEHLDRIFDSFYRIDPSRQRETGGVGLGLAIVRTCIEACGGTVQCKNLPEGGLKVTIRLKPARPTDKVLETTDPSANPPE